MELLTAQQHALEAAARDRRRRAGPGERVGQEEVAALGVSLPGPRGAARARAGGAGDLRRARLLRHRAAARGPGGDLRAARLLERARRARAAAARRGRGRRARAGGRRMRERRRGATSTAELAANRRFHFLLDGLARPAAAAADPPAVGLDRGLPRALLQLARGEDEADRAHGRIVDAIRARDGRLVAELDAHRERALTVLRGCWRESNCVDAHPAAATTSRSTSLLQVEEI